MKYYQNKLAILRDIFGCDSVSLEDGHLRVGEWSYPIVDDVIVLLAPAKYPVTLKARLGLTMHRCGSVSVDRELFAPDIQETFGSEWTEFDRMYDEYRNEFRQYFDLIDVSALKNKRVCDLGCGMGRWSTFLKKQVRELVLIDFSEAIFCARRNLADADHVLYFMGDLRELPFRRDFADFLFCLGVLHHLPTDALSEVKRLAEYAPRILVYLYYALDNKPMYYRALLKAVTGTRGVLCRIRDDRARFALSWALMVSTYLPLISLGEVLRRLGIRANVPLHEAYRGKSLTRIRQDVYDRFFTRIEQRFSRAEIEELKDVFSKVSVSDGFPYWHFVCER